MFTLQANETIPIGDGVESRTSGQASSAPANRSDQPLQRCDQITFMHDQCVLVALPAATNSSSPGCKVCSFVHFAEMYGP